MAFIGPGSEWLWTAVSGLVLAITFLANYRQLRLARNAGAIEQISSFEHEYLSERMPHYELAVLVALRDGTDPADVPDGAADSREAFWDRVAILTRAGHLDRRLLFLSLGWPCQFWWATLAPHDWTRADGGA